MPELVQAIAGRDREVELLERLLEDGCAGSPQLVFVTGEPGIGKTSLLAELLRMAEARGCLVLTGRAAELERELPFGVVVDALDEYLESLDPHAFHRLATEDLDELARVFPALRSLDPGSNEPSTTAERYRVHRAVRALIERLAVKQPLVLALDDLHWADGASLELMSHLLRRPPHARVVLAGAFRARQADSAIRGEIESAMRGSESVHRIALGPLAPADAAALLELDDDAERERLYRTSGGNPFYMLELARLALEHPYPTAEPWGFDVPSAVAAAIAGELDGLSAPSRRLAESAAVAGDPFELDLAMATIGMPQAEALAAIDELAARDVVRPASVPRRFHFRHPLVRHAVYESCAPGARLAAHERCADALAAQGAPAAMRAHHVMHAARPGDRDAVAVLREAGEAAARRAPVSAARWFEVALGLLPEGAADAERLELLMALAGALAATGRFDDGRAALLECIALTGEDGDEALRVKLIGACASVEQLLGHHEEAHRRLTSALEGLADSSSALAVELLIHLAVGDFYRMEYEGMRTWGERALNVAQAFGEPPLAAVSWAVLAVAAAFMGPVQVADACRASAAELVDALSDEELANHLAALTNLSAADLYLHRYDDAETHSKRGLAIARATGQGEVVPVLLPVVGTVLHTTGRVTEAVALLDDAVEAARLSGNVEVLAWNLLSRGYVAVVAGELDLAVAVAQESVDLTRDLDDRLVSTNAKWALASALLETGEPARAVELLLTAAGGEALPRIPEPWRPNYLELLTRGWLASGRSAEAQETATRAAAAAERVGLEIAGAMADRAAAAVALAGGDAHTAADRALAAADAADVSGARVEAARARTLAGRALANANERERAVAELERATEQLDAFGAVRLRQEGEQELRKLGRRPYRRTQPQNAAGVGIETLTQREVEIARLVAKRRTNAEIATELFLSVKTIETHMRNIFRKLDVSSRLDVALAIDRAEEEASRS